MAPINAVMARDWPQASRMNLLDDSLSADLASSGTLDEVMRQRFIALSDYAVEQGADALLFTCSAFGPCIDAVKRRHAGLPVLKPNEAMIDEAVALAGQLGTRIGLIASFGPTLQSMPAEFPISCQPLTALAAGAMQALDAGDPHSHDRLTAEAATALAAQGCGVIALAQFSLSRAGPVVAEATGLPVLSTPVSAVKRLQQMLS